MTIDRASIDALARTLHEGATAPLTASQRNLIVAALAALIAAQDTIARQSLLLRSHEEDGASIDRAVAQAMSRIAGVVSRALPDHGFDYAAAAGARDQLLLDVREAESGRGVLQAALKFAAVAAGLAL